MDCLATRLVRAVAAGVALLLAVAFPALGSDPSRFASKGRVLDGGADWVSIDRQHMVSGGGTRISVTGVGAPAIADRTIELEVPATAGLVAGSSLYLVLATDNGEKLAVANLDAPGFALRDIGFGSRSSSTLTLAQMDDHLIVGESGVGIHILQLPADHDHAGHHEHERSPVAIGFLPFGESILALTASARTIWFASNDYLIEADAAVSALPVLVRRVPAPERARSLAATNRDVVHLLGDGGLWVLDLRDPGASPEVLLDPGVRGNSLLSLGRSVFVAGDTGVVRFQDNSPEAALFNVQVGDVFFNPPGAININIGDTVQWQKPGTVFSHNVRACTSTQAGCGGATATEFFTSGGITTSPFTFAFTFNAAGNNPYLCQVHNLTMQGNVVVAPGGTPPPPAVPRGGLFSPMTVAKLNASGVNLQVSFDTGCPDAVDHDLIFGTSATLPAIPGATYGLTGSRCAAGGSPFNWNATPAPLPGSFLWWVLVADDGGSIEGSWGNDAGGQERNGAGLNGSSGACGNTDKDLTNTCGL